MVITFTSMRQYLLDTRSRHSLKPRAAPASLQR